MFGKSEVKFCGSIIDGNGIRPNPERVEILKKIPTPTTSQQMRKLMGGLNQFRHVIPNFALTVKCLNKFTNRTTTTETIVTKEQEETL